MVIAEIFAKGSAKVPLIENNDVIQTIPAYGSDNSCNEGVLLWPARHRDKLLDTQALHRWLEHCELLAERQVRRV